MKKKIEIVGIILYLFQLLTLPVLANSGYYYEAIDVQVNVNEKREFEITETLDVYFEKEMHGIIRNIPDYSDVEGYEIEDVQVEGANYDVEYVSNGIDIRIGDANKTVKGRQRYVLTYTLKHYQDYDKNHDYIYLNLIGNDFDAPTNKLTAHINWPKEAIVEDYKLTSGKYGTTQNSKLAYEMEEHGIAITSKSKIEAYEAATVQIQLKEGAFSLAPVYEYPYVINNKEIDIEVDSNQDFYITQKIDLTSNKSYLSFPISLDFDMDPYHKIKTENMEFSIDGKKSDEKYYLHIENEGKHTIVMNYKLHPISLMDGIYQFQLNDRDEDTQIENMKLVLSMPIHLQTTFKIGRYDDPTEMSRYEVNQTENRLVFQLQDSLQAAETVSMSLELCKKDFYRPTPFMIQFLTMISILLFLTVLIVRFFIIRNHFIEPVTFYPPKNMNSAEVGYLIDMKCTNEDMTSLIFYWASLGCLKIKGIDKKFTLIKHSNLPVNRPSYEKILFEAMFMYGKDNEVNAKNLKNKFYIDINRARKSILDFYNNKSLYDNSVKKIKVLFMIVPIVLVVLMMGVMSQYDLQIFGVSFVIKLMTMMPSLLFALMMLLISKLITKNAVSPILNAFVYSLVLIPLFIMNFVQIILADNYQIQYLIVMIMCIFTFLIATGIKKYNAETALLIGELRGFKTFLKEAEKEQLEMLLADNPEYYYHILPYAQALHVTKIWQNKFKDIAIAPPTYQEGDRMDYVAFNSFARSISRSMERSMTSPVSSDSHSGGASSGYSGGGGGFSSGGHSGGGSGGGGSRGW